MCKVSIIVPVYKVENTIERCIRSIFGQDYEDYEVIFVDDQGGDDSIFIIASFIDSNQWTKAKIIAHDKNRGLSAARNTGIRASRGDYIYFLDSDDEISTDCLTVFARYLNQENDVDLVQGNFKYIPERWGEGWNMDKYTGDLFLDNPTVIKSLMLTRWPFPVMSWNKMIKRSLVIDHNLFFKEGIIHEDVHWNFFISKYIKSASICLEHTYYYHQNLLGITHGNKDKSRASMKIIISDMSRNLDDECLEDQIQALFYHIYYADFEFLDCGINIYKNKNVAKPLKVLERVYSSKILGERTVAILVNIYMKLIFAIKPKVNTIVISENEC